MTGGLGFVKLMQQNYRSNRKLLRKTSDNMKGNIPTSGTVRKLLLKKSDPNSLKTLREQLILENRLAVRKKIILGAAILAFIVALFFLL